MTEAIADVPMPENSGGASSSSLDAPMLNKIIAHILAGHDITEVYSPPRVTAACEKVGLVPGGALDITTTDKDGRAWDFNQPEMRRRVVKKVLEEDPLLIIGSPMCTAFSTLQQLNKHKIDLPSKVREARVHLQFVAKLYKLQASRGRYFLHEHPWMATSWKLEEIDSIVRMPGVYTVKGSMCSFGMVADDGYGPKPVRKDTGFMTNSWEIAVKLNKPCTNTLGCEKHEHTILMNDRAKPAQRYPPGLVQAIILGLKAQKKIDEAGMTTAMYLNNIEGVSKVRTLPGLNIAEEALHSDDNQCECDKAWDDVTGKELDPDLEWFTVTTSRLWGALLTSGG